MAEEENVTPQVNPEDQNLLAEMEEYKKTHTISNDEYNRVLERNKQLTHNWAQDEAEKAKQADPDTIESLRKDLFSDERKEMSNLDAATKMLKLRDKVLEEGGRDPFAPTNANSEADLKTAERVAAGLQNMVDMAQGDEVTFNALLEKNVDIPSMRINNRR